MNCDLLIGLGVLGMREGGGGILILDIMCCAVNRHHIVLLHNGLFLLYLLNVIMGIFITDTAQKSQ